MYTFRISFSLLSFCFFYWLCLIMYALNNVISVSDNYIVFVLKALFTIVISLKIYIFAIEHIICSYFWKRGVMPYSCMYEAWETSQQCDKKGRNSLHAYSVGLLFPHLSQKVFLGPEHKEVEHTVPRFCILTWMVYRNCTTLRFYYGYFDDWTS